MTSTTYWLSDGTTADAPHTYAEAYQTVVNGRPFEAIIQGYPRMVNGAYVVSWRAEDDDA